MFSANRCLESGARRSPTNFFMFAVVSEKLPFEDGGKEILALHTLAYAVFKFLALAVKHRLDVAPTCPRVGRLHQPSVHIAFNITEKFFQG